jgi:hypothetical protein
MGGFSFFHDIAAFIRYVFATANAAFTAGGSGNNVQVVGVIVDRSAYDMPLSTAIGIRWKATLQATQTLSLSWVLQHGTESNLGDASTFVSGGPTVVATGPAGGGTLEGVLQIPVDLGGAEEFLRFEFTPDLSASGTDTGEADATFVFGGQSEIPA